MSNKQLCACCLREQEIITAKLWCNDCNEAVCQPCAKAHRRFLTPHNIVQFQNVPALSQNIRKVCSKHSGQVLSLFCPDHDEIICNLCLPDHRTCNKVLSTHEASNGIKNSPALSDLFSRMKKLESETEIFQRSSISCLSESETQKNVIKEQLTGIREGVDKHLKLLEKNVEYRYNEIVSTLVSTSEKIKTLKDNIHKNLDSIKIIMNTSNDVHAFHAFNHLSHIQTKEEEQFNIANETLKSMKFNDIPTDIMNKLDELFKPLEKMSPQLPLPNKLPEFQKSKQHFENGISEETKQDSQKYQVFKSAPNSKFGASCFTDDNKLYILEHDKHFSSLSFINTENSEKSSIKLKYLSYSVAFIDDSIALVTGDKYITVVNVKTQTVGRQIELNLRETPYQWEINACKHIIVSPKRWTEKTIWVVIEHTPKRQTIEQTAKRQSTASIQGRQNKHAICSVNLVGSILTVIEPAQKILDVCYDSISTHFYYTNVYTNQIHTLNEKESIFYDNVDITEGCYLTLQSTGHLFVAERKSDTISLVSKNSRKPVLKREHGISRPSHINYNTKTKELVVIMESGSSCVIYRI